MTWDNEIKLTLMVFVVVLMFACVVLAIRLSDAQVRIKKLELEKEMVSFKGGRNE